MASPPKLLPGPDGRSKAKTQGPVKHKRSDLLTTFSVDIDDSDEPDLERIVATRHADAIIAFIFGSLVGFGPGRITTALIHNGWTYLNTDHDVVAVHVVSDGKMKPVLQLVDRTAPAPAAPEPEPEPATDPPQEIA